MSPDLRQSAPQEAKPYLSTYSAELRRFFSENGVDPIRTDSASRTPALEAELDDYDGAIALPPELQTYVETIFKRPMLCEKVSLQLGGFVITLQTIPTFNTYRDFVPVQPPDRELPIGVDREIVFNVADNKCSIGVYEPPFEFTFDSWQERFVPFDIGSVGTELMQAVKQRTNSKIVLHKTDPPLK